MAARPVPTPVRIDGTAGPDDETLPADIATRIFVGWGPAILFIIILHCGTAILTWVMGGLVILPMLLI